MIAGFELLVLLVAVNGAPILAARLLGRRWNAPVDGGFRWPDGGRVFGAAKTWRGLLAGLLAGVLLAVLLAYGPGATGEYGVGRRAAAAGGAAVGGTCRPAHVDQTTAAGR